MKHLLLTLTLIFLSKQAFAYTPEVMPMPEEDFSYQCKVEIFQNQKTAERFLPVWAKKEFVVRKQDFRQDFTGPEYSLKTDDIRDWSFASSAKSYSRDFVRGHTVNLSLDVRRPYVGAAEGTREINLLTRASMEYTDQRSGNSFALDSQTSESREFASLEAISSQSDIYLAPKAKEKVNFDQGAGLTLTVTCKRTL